jgi:metal-responsive CopG/Arc/MetJ family transcriptional regulator
MSSRMAASGPQGRDHQDRKQQKDKPSRSEAIRRLIEYALAIKGKTPRPEDR